MDYLSSPVTRSGATCPRRGLGTWKDQGSVSGEAGVQFSPPSSMLTASRKGRGVTPRLHWFPQRACPMHGKLHTSVGSRFLLGQHCSVTPAHAAAPRTWLAFSSPGLAEGSPEDFLVINLCAMLPLELCGGQWRTGRGAALCPETWGTRLVEHIQRGTCRLGEKRNILH